MEQATDIQQLLEQTIVPAFLVKSNIITYANESARRRMIPLNGDIAELISIGETEYSQHKSGTLSLTLSVSGASCGATVIRASDWDIFYMDSPLDDPELRAFTLAAQHLREPLSNCLNITEIMQPEVNEHTAEHLARLNRNLHQLHRNLNNMSDAAHYETVRTSRLEVRELSALFGELLEGAAHLISHSDKTLKIILPNKNIYALVDAEKLERAVYNLITNAVKNTIAGGVITAEFHASGNKAYFSVSNNTPYLQPGNIFSRFLQEPGLPAGSSGLGLGLTIVRKVAAAHGGTLLMEQDRNDSVRFTMSISLKRPEDSILRSQVRLPVDYSGGYDHALLELSDVLPPELYHV